MLHVKHMLKDRKGNIVTQWEFFPVSVMATVQFIKAVIANNDGKHPAAQYVIEIGLPERKDNGHK